MTEIEHFMDMWKSNFNMFIWQFLKETIHSYSIMYHVITDASGTGLVTYFSSSRINVI